MPRYRFEDEYPSPESVETAKVLVRARLRRLLDNAHDQQNAEQQLAIKLGLPHNRFDWQQIDRLTELLWEKFKDKKGLVQHAERWLKNEQRRHPNPLSPAEEKTLAVYLAANAGWQFYFYLEGYFSLDYAAGKSGRQRQSSVYEEGAVQQVGVPEIFPSFLSPKPISYPSDLSHYHWNRGFDMYDEVTLEKPQTLLEKRIQKDGSITLLDEGRGDAFLLNQAKQTFGRSIRTLGIGLINARFPDRPIDDDYIGPAELLPARWSNSVDVAFSLQAYRYFLYPERAVQETLRVLKPGGEAHLDIATHHESSLTAIFDDYLTATGSDTTAEEYFQQNFAGFQDAQTTIQTVQRLAQAAGMTVSVSCENDQIRPPTTNRLHIHKHA